MPRKSIYNEKPLTVQSPKVSHMAACQPVASPAGIVRGGGSLSMESWNKWIEFANKGVD
jgi:hypothetical protein